MTVPMRIWLQHEESDTPFVEDTTWSGDQVWNSDIEYILATCPLCASCGGTKKKHKLCHRCDEGADHAACTCWEPCPTCNGGKRCGECARCLVEAERERCAVRGRDAADKAMFDGKFDVGSCVTAAIRARREGE